MDLQSVYKRILAAAEDDDAPPYWIEIPRLFAREAIWKSDDGLVAALPRSLMTVMRDRARRWLDSDAERGASWGFQILGVKDS